MLRTPFLTDILKFQQDKTRRDDRQKEFGLSLSIFPDINILFYDPEKDKDTRKNSESINNPTFTPRDPPNLDQFKQEKKITIKKKDLQSLSGSHWLNDEVINSFLDYLHNTHAESSIGYTNTFFYESLKKNGNEYASKWNGIKGCRVDIFSQFLIPIATSAHWFLIDLDFENHTMNIYDSLPHRYTTHVKNISEFLKYQGISPLQVKYPSVPKQTTHCDCGVFLLKFASMIYDNEQITKNSFKQKDITLFRSEIKKILSEYVKQK